MTDVSRKYENFLEHRRKGNNFLWISRELNLQCSYKQPNQPSPAFHKKSVLNYPQIQELLNKISARQNISKSELEKQVTLILDEIGYNRKLKLIRWLGLVLTKICLKVCSGIHVNRGKVQEIKAVMGNCPVIFVPTHRSYIDFISMAYICFGYDIEIPTVAAGMDFHGMVGMGTMLRNTGAFFMRRSYSDDNLYWTTFKQYVYQIVTKGHLPIEFFIEGTRSRSNKSLMPKYGNDYKCIPISNNKNLLKVIELIQKHLRQFKLQITFKDLRNNNEFFDKAFFFAQVPDILFVPISINYDRIFEETLFAYELLGVPKPKESTSGFFKSMKILKETFGNIYFHFDDPISAKEFFGSKLDRSIHSMGPLHTQELTDYEKSLMPPLANEILYRQQKSSTITVFNLMSIIINENLTRCGKTLTIFELTEEVCWLKNALEAFGAYIQNTDVEDSIKEAFIVHSNLIEMTSDYKIQLVTNEVTQGKINPKKLKGHLLSDQTMTYSVPFVTLQIYINPNLHYLIDAALLVNILNIRSILNKEAEIRVLACVEHDPTILPCRYLDVVMAGSKSNCELTAEFETVLQQMISLNLIELTKDGFGLGNNEKLQKLLSNSIKPFKDSYLVTVTILENLPVICDEKTILGNVQQILERVINERKEFVHPYCLNLDTLVNCLTSLCSMGVLKKTRRENKNMYEIHKEKLSETKEKLEMYVSKLNIGEYNLTVNSLENKL